MAKNPDFAAYSFPEFLLNSSLYFLGVSVFISNSQQPSASIFGILSLSLFVFSFSFLYSSSEFPLIIVRFTSSGFEFSF